MTTPLLTAMNNIDRIRRGEIEPPIITPERRKEIDKMVDDIVKIDHELFGRWA